MNMRATFIADDGTETTYQGEQAWSMMQAQSKPYAGVSKLKQIPSTKKGYKGKNAAGGRKAMFTQSREYKRSTLYGICIPWDVSKLVLLDECRKVRAELVQAIANDA